MTFSSDAHELKTRILRRISPGELFALALAFGALGVFTRYSSELDFVGYDFSNYLATAHGNFEKYYYGYWLLPVFAVLAKLPFPAAYVLWGGANILAVFFAVRLFGGRIPVVLLSYQMLYGLIYGQIIGIVAGGLALFWWGLVNRKWHVAGLAAAVVSAKYQIGLTGCLFLLLAADASWKDRLRVMIVPILIWAASLVVYPGWPVQALDILINQPPDANGSIALWRWIGPWALLLWIPPFILKVSPQQRFLALVAATGLALPYFQQTDLLFLMALPIGLLGLLGNLGYLLGVFGWVALRLLVILPLIVYVLTLWPACAGLVQPLWIRIKHGRGIEG